MSFVCPLRIKLTATRWAFDFLQLGGPNVSVAITTTSCSNAILLLRITYEVAPMDSSMLVNGISAYNNFVFFPSMTFTVEKLRLGTVSTLLTCGHVFPQFMITYC